MAQDEQYTMLRAIWNGRSNQVRQLITARCTDLSDQYGETPLMIAAKQGYEDITRLLRGAGADIDAINKIGETALTLAAREGHVNIIAILLEAGCDTETVDRWGKTALMHAGHNFEATLLLLQAGADILAQDDEERTVLMHCKRPEVARILIEKGVDVNATDYKNRTALMHAAKYPQVAAVLANQGAKVDLWTFYRGISLGNIEYMRVLVDAPASLINIDGNDGRRLLRSVRTNIQSTETSRRSIFLNDLVTLLISRGAK